jgi:preprotein translocase subunit SecE
MDDNTAYVIMVLAVLAFFAFIIWLTKPDR